ncbi:MAG: hypothetical protein E7253_10605 [Lachnospiraceae bacterium]|nr:hypothetical protein [Lachnospiraceae bacterium]
MNGKYDDIINLPHPESKKHPRMSLQDRAAQFSPFAALTGHSAAIDETARLTDRKLELNEEKKAELDRMWQYLLEKGKEKPRLRITYFVKDEKKAGGLYTTVSDRLKKIEPYKKTILMGDGTGIYYQDIYEIEIEKEE